MPATDPAGLRSPFSIPAYGRDHRLRVVLGPQDDRFTDDGVRTFLSAAYTVTAQSDRMGSRLAGPRIAHRAGADIVSDGTPLGAVQVAGDGVPIVLMADRGTAGGYAKIATVVSVDVGRLGQAAPGDTVRFTAVTVGEAHAALREQAALLQDIRQFVAAGTTRASSGARTGTAARTRREKAAAAAAAVARLLDRE